MTENIIAIDGPSSSGKGTLGRAIAKHYGLHYLDTGLLYRELGRQALNLNFNPDALTIQNINHLAAIATNIDIARIEPEKLRDEDIAGATSKIAAIAAIRKSLLLLQRQFAKRKPGAVVDGRDIGTVVLPQAPVKLFITANAEVRAKRRSLELQSSGQVDTITSDYDYIYATIRTRDDRDETRKKSPALAAADAVIIDTTDLNVEQALTIAFSIIDKYLY